MYSAHTRSAAMRRSKNLVELAARAVLLLSSTLVALVVTEIFLRLFPGVLPNETQLRIHWQEVEEKTSTIAHPYLGFMLPPNRLGTRTSTDFTFSFKTDEHGFRNPSPWPPTAEIVVAGDSMAFSYGVDDEAAWTRLLDERLSMSRLINLGLIGAAPQQYLRAFETFGLPLKPKLFVFALFPGNDLDDAERFDEWVAAGSPGNYDVWRYFGGKTPDSIKSALQQTYLFALLKTFRNSFRLPEFGTNIEFSDGGKIQFAPRIYAVQAARARPSQQAFDRVISIIEKAQEMARTNGVQFVTLLFPTKEEVYLPLYGKHAPDLVGPYVRKLDELRIPHVDLTAPLQIAARAGITLYFEIDGHPNDRGYQAVAKAVYAHLAANAAAYGLKDWMSKAE